MCASLSPVTGPLLICWNLGVQQALRRIRWWSRAEAGWALVLSRARSSAVAMSASTHQAGVPSSLLGACLGMLTALSLFLMLWYWSLRRPAAHAAQDGTCTVCERIVALAGHLHSR